MFGDALVEPVGLRVAGVFPDIFCRGLSRPGGATRAGSRPAGTDRQARGQDGDDEAERPDLPRPRVDDEQDVCEYEQQEVADIIDMHAVG